MTILLVPAAGSGSRLGSPLPKVLTPVAGRPMMDHLLALYAEVADRFVFVVKPGVDARVVERGRAAGVRVECALQAVPTGMLDAILAPLARVRELRPEWVWITWCDQVAVLPETVVAIRELLRRGSEIEEPRLHLVLATCPQASPYIHFDRDAAGRLVGLRQRREGDTMPATGESDAGLFVLSFEAYTELLPVFAGEAAPGSATGERNFLPFVTWLSARHPASLATVACREPIESVGINTPEELRRVETHLLARRSAGSQSPS